MIIRGFIVILIPMISPVSIVMKIRLLTIGQKMPAWVLTGFEDYFKRIQPFVQTQVIELPMAKRGKNDSQADILKYCQLEGESILNFSLYASYAGKP